MVRDEAPAATFGGINGKRNVTARKIGIGPDDAGFDSQGSGPTSLVAAEFHLGWRPAVLSGGWPQCNIQVACHPTNEKFHPEFNWLTVGNGTRRRAPPLIRTRKPKN
jgi:hypothetical protein